MHEVRFYTFPPYSVPYSYVLVNPWREQQAISYIKKHLRSVRSIIIDSGVEIFRKGAREYPSGALKHFMRLLAIRKRIASLTKDVEIYVVVPDYPSDYKENPLPNNIERTLSVLRVVRERFSTEFLIASVQSKGIFEDLNLASLRKAVRMYREEGIFDDFDYFGIGNSCTLNERMGLPVNKLISFVVRSASIVRQQIGNKKLHVFGLWLKALPYVASYIDSFDSLKWTRPVSRRLRKNWSAKNEEERVLYFLAYLNEIKKKARGFATLDAFLNAI